MSDEPERKEAMTSQDPHPVPVRRDFLTLLTVATAAVGAGAFAWPFLDSLNGPVGGGKADEAIDVDLSHLLPGQQIVVSWRGNPVFVVRRDPAALARLREPGLQALLRDPASAERQQPDYAANWHRSIAPEFGVMVGICTHLGCVPRYRPAASAPDAGSAWPGGYACPCHGSRFDLAGRVFAGSPAGYNLPVPPYSLLSPSRLRIGTAAQEARFDFDQIRQI